jgi:hypothetical protein
MPLPDVNVSNGGTNYTRVAEIDNLAKEYSGKVEHKFTDKVSLTGFYLWNHTDEPCSNYYEVGKSGATRFADPNDYLLKRTPQIPRSTTPGSSAQAGAALRYGWTRFVDNSTMTIDFDPSTLGFSSTFMGQVGQTGVAKFPQGGFTNGYSGFGAINPSYRTYKSSGFNGSFSKFVGTHTYKIGADYRKIGVYLLNPGNASGISSSTRNSPRPPG